MDRMEVCRAIKLAPATRDTSVVLLIAAADELLRQRAVDAGTDDVAVKPVEQATLLTLVRAQLRITHLKSQINELEAIVVTLARAVEDRDQSSAGLAEKVAHWARQLGPATGLPHEQPPSTYEPAFPTHVDHLP